MRALGVDFGMRRIGLALSDASATLARPYRSVRAGDTPRTSAAAVAAILTDLNSADPDVPVGIIVVGLPRRLGGEDNAQTPVVRQFAAALEAATRLPVALQDERLTSHEADERLAVRERDWRRRKEMIDAAAAAIILQDYLDGRTTQPEAAS